MYDVLTGAKILTRAKKEMLTVRINASMAARLRSAADGAGKSLSAWMRDALMRSVDASPVSSGAALDDPAERRIGE